jgi:hypothetical protein
MKRWFKSENIGIILLAIFLSVLLWFYVVHIEPVKIKPVSTLTN